eukprot:scaffold11559_cov128-Isochrysis_galbana.AAC.4
MYCGSVYCSCTVLCAITPYSYCAVLYSYRTPRARGGVTMAPLQLRLEPTEVVLVLATYKGAARARVDSTDESSPQV